MTSEDFKNYTAGVASIVTICAVVFAGIFALVKFLGWEHRQQKIALAEQQGLARAQVAVRGNLTIDARNSRYSNPGCDVDFHRDAWNDPELAHLREIETFEQYVADHMPPDCPEMGFEEPVGEQHCDSYSLYPENFLWSLAYPIVISNRSTVPVKFNVERVSVSLLEEPDRVIALHESGADTSELTPFETSEASINQLDLGKLLLDVQETEIGVGYENQLILAGTLTTHFGCGVAERYVSILVEAKVEHLISNVVGDQELVSTRKKLVSFCRIGRYFRHDPPNSPYSTCGAAITLPNSQSSPEGSTPPTIQELQIWAQ